MKHGLGVMVALLVLTLSCARNDVQQEAKEAREVVVYTALDRGFSEPILQQFEAETGIKVLPRYDTEATKTIGLVNAIRAEKGRPRCDVFWNNEIVNTIRLKREGLLAAYAPEAAGSFPATFRDPDAYWTGFAARARVFLVNTDLVPEGEEPRHLTDMADPKWKGKVGIAKPLFGTTASHMACLYASWGAARTQEFLNQLKANEVSIEASNKQVALSVAAGRLAFCITDTDDAIIEVEAGRPVKIVYMDAEPDELGTLFIPNTLALVADSPNPEAGKLLIEYLLSPPVEEALAKAASAQIPLNPMVETKTRVKTPKEVKAMEVDFNQAAAAFDDAAKYVEAFFLE